MRRKVEVEMDPLLPADLGRADPVYPLLATRVCAVLSLPSGLIELVVAYATPYQMRGYRSDKLECAGNEPIQGTERAFAYRMSEGTVVSWGDKQGWSNQVQARLKYAKALCANRVAFAAIAADDTVVCWGPHTDDTQTIDEMVEGICASDEAFAALKMDGTVMAWGNKDQGGDCSSVQSQLKRVRAISSTLHAFAAVLHDGTVETWGHPDFGGLIPLSTKERLWQVLSISGSDRAFAALMEDGTVETWGKLEFPVASAPWRTCTRDAAELTNGWGDVVAICAAAEAFAALRRDGTVVCLPSVMTELKGVVAISSTKTLFAALKSDGHVVTWGGDFSNGEARASLDTVQQLYNVVAVYGGPYAFAALRGDGTVVTWGHEEYGGDSSKVQKDLRQVVAIRSTAKAFAARRSDGYVVTWGSSFFGGDRSSVPALRLPGETFRIYLHRVLFCGVVLVFIGCLTIPVALAITHRVD